MSRGATCVALLGAALLAAPAARGERARPGDIAEVGRLIEAWRFDEAEAAVARLRAASPTEPAVDYLEAVTRFHRGDYQGASDRLAALVQRLGHGPGLGARAEFQGFVELVESTREATRGFVEARSPEGHFVVRYQPGRDQLLLPYAFATLEAARREIGERDFGAAELLADPVRVEIYPDVKDLAKVSTLTIKEIETSGTIAVCKFNRLMVTSPRALVHGYPWLDTLAHEFTHLVVTRLSHNTVPIWLHEGLAKYEERRWRAALPPPLGPGTGAGLSPTMEHLLASALGRGRRLVTLEEMSPSMAKLPSQEETALAFAEVYTLIEYLLGKRGWDGVRALVGRLRDGASDSAAVAAVMGQSFDEVQRSWQRWLRGLKLRARPGLLPGALRFARPAGKAPPRGGTAGEDVDDAQEVSEERARRLVRLGGLLRARQRVAAAASEYEKAQQLVGPGHPVVALKLARVQLALGDLDAAIATATPAFELYPDSGGAAAVLGDAWMRKGDAGQAARFLEASLATNPFDPAPHCALAGLYERGSAPAAAAAPSAPPGSPGSPGQAEPRNRQRASEERAACSLLASGAGPGPASAAGAR